ncbi:hypothetical protein LI328DRAFT_170240 [Trichoderma asperelloides]|nr:hypothetical protein LI328DRAFT_170240 [Trichoderma asperelloides]
MHHPMAGHSPAPVPGSWDRSPHCPSSANQWRAPNNAPISLGKGPPAGGRQSIPATGCLPSTGHSRRLAGPLQNPGWMRAPASPSEYHPASGPSKIAQSERTGNERLWYHRRHFARRPCQWQSCETPVPCSGPGPTAIWETLGCGAHPGSVAQVLVAKRREVYRVDLHATDSRLSAAGASFFSSWISI